jgi:hypothetical protein
MRSSSGVSHIKRESETRAKSACHRFGYRLGPLCGTNRDVLRVTCLPLRANRRRTPRAHVTNLVDTGAHCGTHRRHTLFEACLLFDGPQSPSWFPVVSRS